MAPRSTPPPRTAYQPPTDASTYRDLLLFEERLKTNAAILKRRKSRYQFFLLQLLLIIAFLLAEVFLNTRLLSVPYAYLLRKVLPDIYGPGSRSVGKGDGAPAGVAPGLDPELHPYFAYGLLLVSVTTLVLFFATGLYTEKIGYANRYVPHANKALRSLNMHLNVRQPPLRSRLPIPNPLALLFPRTTPSTPSAPSSPAISPRRRSASPSRSPLSLDPASAPAPPPAPADPASPVTQALPVRAARRSAASGAVPLSPIPPSANPRGELIFSARVDRAFRDGYERYRAAFERKREERERAVLAATWRGTVWLALSGRLWGVSGPAVQGTGVGVTPVPSRSGTPQPGGKGKDGAALSRRESRGRIGAASTGSRKGSPAGMGRRRLGTVDEPVKEG